MTTTQRQTLAYGYNDGLVDGLTCAYGARLIVTQDGGVDFVHDRQDMFGPEDRQKALGTWLNAKLGDAWPEHANKSAWQRAMVNLQDWLRDYKLRTSEAQPTILHQDKIGAVIGDTKGSYGYFYAAAYRFEDLPEGHPTKGLEIVIDGLKAMREAEGR